ncbi:MAG: beta strand repeat-containing protein, partial [Candidatus Omnitrophota bacterium]
MKKEENPGPMNPSGFISRSGICYLLSAILLLFIILVNPVSGSVWPDPGDWPVWGSQAADITPASWPAEGDWHSYTAKGSALADPAVADPSNGGTSPQNYVSVTSNCPDKTLPSVYWYFNPVKQVLYFRFRLSAIPCTYATGPSAGAAATTDPWRSAQWSVLIDIDGDGYREFAMQLDGSTGGPSTPVDRLSIIYSANQSNSLDYATIGSGIYLVNQFPTAFVNASGGSILNFHNTNTPNTTWANGSAETVWDYGMTRCRNVTVGGCTEYITDYQIPLSMLDATGVGGPALTQNTSMSFLFATANSLQNPFQKDVVTLGDLVYIGDPVKPAPYGDTITPAGGDSLPQPIVASVTVSGCHPATLTATVNDAVDIVAGNAVTTVSSVQFYYYADADGDGLANDGSTWTLIGAGSTTNNPIGTWTASWESTSLAQGRYLIGAKATDGQGNVTWSWMDPADIGSIGSTPPNYANPTNTGQIFTLFTNTCGAPPSYAVVTSDASAPVLPGAAVTFTVTVTNTSGAPITVSSITDTLPAGFTYQSTGGGTLGAPSGTPGVGDSGAITWTFPPASIPAGASRTLIFTANASNTAGTYTDTASAVTSVGTLDTDPTPVSVGSPQLSLNMSVSAASVSPGGTLTYTITYANTSPVNITGAVISNPLPDGVTYDSNTGGGTYTAGTQTVSWSIGDLAAGESGSVTVTVNVDDPFPSDATIPVVNTATLESNEALTASASASAYVSAPRPTLSLQKSATSATIAENNNVTFTISYFNTGNATATSLTLTDAVPSGLSFVSATGGGTHNAGTVTWNLADLAANASGSVTVTLHVPAGYAGDNPIVNTASISASGVDSVTNSFWLGVNQTDNQCNTYYFSNTTEDMGVDGVQYLATTTAPTGAGTNLHATLPSFPATPVPFTEITRFYSPTTANAIDFSGNLTTTYWVDRANGNALDVKVTVYDYDSTTGAKTQLGTNTVALGGSSKGMQSFTVALSGALSKSHRLLWVIEGAEQQKNKTDDIYFQFGGTVTNPISGGTVSATSNGAVCFTPPANLVIDKQVNVLNANPGDTLTYTILFSNTGQTAASGAQVTDTLPTGVTYASATLNGGAVAPASQVGQAVTFNVNSSDTGIAGRVSGGQSGSLVITATIDNPLDSGITTLTNTAALVSNETATVSDTATTSVLRPAVTVIQSATPSLVEPNDPVTYTLTVINSGTSSATNVTLNDVLPVQAYYTYVPGSTTLNGGAVADHVAGGTLNYNIGTLDAGETAVVTLQMKAGAAGSFPATQTNLSNTATVSDSQTVGSRSSNTVAVTINPLPNLSITNSFSPGGPYTAGDIITCEITVTNTGGSDALGVVVIEGIPAYTTYVPGSLVVEAASKTDVSGDDTANFDSAGNRTVFRIGTVPSGATRTMSFQVRVQGSMPSGSTTLTGTAEVSASNAASKSLTDTGVVAAEPTLSVSKIGPANSPYPAAAVTATSAGTTVSVDDVSPFVVNQYIRVAGQNRQITAISGSTLTIDSAANVTDGDSVTGSLTYTLQYSNTGSADAAGATLVDTLPGGAIYVSSTGGGVYAPGPGTVTWTIGSLPVNASGLVQVILFPGAAGSLTNSAAISATAVNPLSASVTTGVGGLHIRKHTTTPSVGQGGTAVYVIEVENTHSATATGVVVTDTLPSGFTYSSTASITGGTRTATNDPSSGDQAPSWGTFSIASGDTLTITFNAAIAAGIAGTFDNELSVTSTNTSVGTFDPLLTTAEDVAVSEAVIPAPSGSLSNSTGAISVGCSASLSWTAANATSGTLNPGNIAVTVGNGSGSISVTPSETTAYTLSLSGPGGTVSYNATVTVNAAPAITAFSASPSTIAAGASVTFSATFTGGTGVITPGNYAIVSGGTYVLATGPSESTAY